MIVKFIDKIYFIICPIGEEAKSAGEQLISHKINGDKAIV
jgi:hypothetical protein